MLYGYNDNGQLTIRGSDTFSWGDKNDLLSATIDSATAGYTYDGSGIRDSRTFDSTTTYYTWTWGTSLPVVLTDGELHYIYGNGRIMATDGSGAVDSYFLYDGLGSVANVTDAAGDVLVTYTYDAFGGIRAQSAGSDNYWTFAGEQSDEGSGFQYLRARYYDPGVGRFLSNDPLGGGYPYAGNNPVNATDPTGLVTCSRVVEGSASSWASPTEALVATTRTGTSSTARGSARPISTTTWRFSQLQSPITWTRWSMSPIWTRMARPSMARPSRLLSWSKRARVRRCHQARRASLRSLRRIQGGRRQPPHLPHRQLQSPVMLV